MKKITIDFTGAKNYDEVHKIIKDSFQNSEVRGFPDFYGENLDALWDCLTGFIEKPVEITIKGSKLVAKDLLPEMEGVLRVLNRAQEQKIWGIVVHVLD